MVEKLLIFKSSSESNLPDEIVRARKIITVDVSAITLIYIANRNFPVIQKFLESQEFNELNLNREINSAAALNLSPLHHYLASYWFAHRFPQFGQFAAQTMIFSQEQPLPSVLPHPDEFIGYD